MTTLVFAAASLASSVAFAQDGPRATPPAEVAEPEATEPDIAEPEATEPDTADTGATVAATAEPPAEPPTLTLAPHIGVGFSQPFSELGAAPLYGIEVGYLLPFDVGSVSRPLALQLDVQFTNPGADGSGQDPNLGLEGATYSWELTQRMLLIDLHGLWRFMTAGQGLSAYALLGPRLYLMESVLTGDGNGADFGETRETNTEVGLLVGGGVEYTLGPGAVFGSLEIGYSNLDQQTTGSANTGSLVLDVGYRFMF